MSCGSAHGELWLSVEDSLRDCDQLVQKLGTEVEKAGTPAVIGRISFGRSGKTIKLNMKEKEFNL